MSPCREANQSSPMPLVEGRCQPRIFTTGEMNQRFRLTTVRKAGRVALRSSAEYLRPLVSKVQGMTGLLGMRARCRRNRPPAIT